MIKDRNIAWQRKSRIITAHELMAGGGGTGAPPLAEIGGGFGFSGVALTNTDEIQYLDFVTPREMDLSEEIGIRWVWTPNATAQTSDSQTLTTVYDQVDVGEVFATAATALDTVIVAQTTPAVTAYIMYRSSRGIIDGGTFDETARQGAIAWDMTATVSGAGAGEICILALEIDYLPRLTWGNGEALGGLNKNLAASS